VRAPLREGVRGGSIGRVDVTGELGGPAAGHTPYSVAWATKLSRTGQTHSWRAHTSPSRRGAPIPVFSPDRPAWNERIPVWEQRIPQWQTERLANPVSRQRSHSSFLSPSPSVASATSSHIVTRDWSLLFSPGRVDTLIRRPWPEYEPESSAAVGRRWNGCNLGRLYEHVPPAFDQTSSLMSGPVA